MSLQSSTGKSLADPLLGDDRSMYQRSAIAPDHSEAQAARPDGAQATGDVVVSGIAIVVVGAALSGFVFDPDVLGNDCVVLRVSRPNAQSGNWRVS